MPSESSSKNKRIKLLVITKKDLIALTEEGELCIWQGSPGELTITYMPIIIPVGNSAMTTVIPMVNGRKISFLHTRISDITKISPVSEGEDVSIEYRVLQGIRHHSGTSAQNIFHYRGHCPTQTRRSLQ